MKLTLDDIVDKHKGETCVISLHGPSLAPYIDKIQDLQKLNKITRLSVNEWFDYFEEKPDYWVVSNTEFNIRDSILNENVWKIREYPIDVFNTYKIPLIYNRAADLTDPTFVDENLDFDYLPYDNKHFKGHGCIEILKNFKKHYEENKNLDFEFYGNNKQMWQLPDTKNENVNQWCAQVHAGLAGGWSKTGHCCHLRNDELTLQEKLQEYSGHDRHCGVGQTVGLFCVAIAILMGFKKIYIVGLDLDYSLGYADGYPEDKNYYVPNVAQVGHWKYVYKDFLLDDMKILRESAALKGAEIINLNKEAWYDEFTKGDLNL